MRLAFMGSPDFAVPALRALHAAGHTIAAVYCQRPKPAGRGYVLRPCPVQVEAERLGLPVRTPARLRGDAAEQAAFAALGLDAAVVAAYGLILPQAMLDAPRRGCLNIHASLLPRWRGAAPIQTAVLAGDAETGVTIMRMDAGLDTGPMLLREAVPIAATTTAAMLHDVLAEIGARLVLRALAEDPVAVPQPEAGGDLCAEADARCGTDRLDARRRCDRAAGARVRSVARHVHHAARRGSEGAGGCAGRRVGTTRHGAGRAADRCLRQRRAAADTGPVGWPPGDGGGRVPTRAWGAGRDGAGQRDGGDRRPARKRKRKRKRKNSPSPCGRGLGGGARTMRLSPPPPNPLPQGEGETSS